MAGGAAGLAVFAPHFVWWSRTTWLPLTYASSRASSQPTRAALEFLLTQLLNHLPLLLIAGITAWRVRNSGPGAGAGTPPCRAMC